MECSNLPGIVACAVIPIMGGWTLRTVRTLDVRTLDVRTLDVRTLDVRT
jgi:hypothetical protein